MELFFRVCVASFKQSDANPRGTQGFTNPYSQESTSSTSSLPR